jgi:hypothetical protein
VAGLGANPRPSPCKIIGWCYKKLKSKPSHFKGRQLFKSKYTEMKKLNVLFRKRPSLGTVLFATAGAMCLALLPLFFASCEEDESDVCGEYLEFDTGRYKLTKSDLNSNTVPSGTVQWGNNLLTGKDFVEFSYNNSKSRCSKNEFGWDMRTVVDLWVYAQQWPIPGFEVSGKIEGGNYDKIPFTIQVSGAGPYTYHFQCTNGWMDLKEEEETAKFTSTVRIEFPTPSLPVNQLDYIVDSLKLEVRNSDFYYRIK